MNATSRHTLDVFFDCSSPWTYLAFHRLQAIIRETACLVNWRPILVGGVFNAVNRGLYEQRSQMTKSLRDTSREVAPRESSPDTADPTATADAIGTTATARRSDGQAGATNSGARHDATGSSATATTDPGGARRKALYYVKDLADWARLTGLRIGQPPVFPVNSVRAMRGCFVAEEEGRLVDWANAVFETYWGNLEDISQPEVLRRIASRIGLDPDNLLARIETPACKAQLRANTDELIARGGFGSPTFFVDRADMYFGNDRLELVRAALNPEAPSARPMP